jgi:hypothetical protein
LTRSLSDRLKNCDTNRKAAVIGTIRKKREADFRIPDRPMNYDFVLAQRRLPKRKKLANREARPGRRFRDFSHIWNAMASAVKEKSGEGTQYSNSVLSSFSHDRASLTHHVRLP